LGELGSTAINNSDIGKWPGEAVFCHNDLTPRNLILQSRASLDGKSKYKLAGIIDWELAGFYPASYELSLQDIYLGANRHVSFYLLLKEHMKNFVPRSLSQIVLLQAMELIFESQQMLLSDGTNILAHFRKRFIENSKLARDNDPYVGWTRSP
jgi:thiamine kinase-like enzyme